MSDRQAFRCRYCRETKPGQFVRSLVAGSLFRHGAMEWVCDDCQITPKPADPRPWRAADAKEKRAS